MSKQPNYVFVLDTNRKPLAPCKPSIARKLLNAGKAKVFKLYPFTIILNKEISDTPEPLSGAENVPLQIEHIQPRAKGGSNRISNLCLACEPCNIKKGTKDVQVFLKKKPDVLKKILAQAKRPLKDAAAVNSTRWALLNRLKAIVTSGKKIGTYTGRVAVRSTGSFNISASVGLIQGISHKYCQQIHQKDGYGYGF